MPRLLIPLVFSCTDSPCNAALDFDILFVFDGLNGVVLLTEFSELSEWKRLHCFLFDGILKLLFNFKEWP